MSKEDKPKLTIRIPVIKADSEAQTSGRMRVLTPDVEKEDMETEGPHNLRKRRNLSKNRGQARQREKTPEPARLGMTHEDTPSSDEEVNKGRAKRNSREIEAEDTYKEMMRLVQEQAAARDPDDLDQEEIQRARNFAENERRRRSISPFAVPDKEELSKLQRKGSFVDPENKLLSTTFTLSSKEDEGERRNSPTTDSSPVRTSSLSASTPTSGSPRDGPGFPYPPAPSPKKQTEMVYPDEIGMKTQKLSPGRSVLTPVKKESDVFTFDEEPSPKTKPKTPISTKTETQTDGLVTKVYTVERSPSRKLAPEDKPVVEIRSKTPVATVERSKSISETRPVVLRKTSFKRESLQEVVPPRPPPVKPARSKSACRFGGKTSESEMSEDQTKIAAGAPVAAKRRTREPPRRFLRNKSPPRVARSQSVARVTDVRDKTGTGMSQTSRDIMQLFEQRARSLSIPKDDPRVPAAYRHHESKRRNLATPLAKSPASRNNRGISCPKTIQLISSTEILAGLSKVQKLELEFEKTRKSKYIDASQSEYTSSCYSSSPSENEYDFNLVNKTAELNRKLSLLSQDVDLRDGIFLKDDSIADSKSILTKRLNHTRHHDSKREHQKQKIVKQDGTTSKEKVRRERKASKLEYQIQKDEKPSRFKLIREWIDFKRERTKEYTALKLQLNRCVSNVLILIIMCGVGGMLFKNLEGSFENTFKCGSRNVKRDFIENLWKGAGYLREEDWKAMARQKLHEFEDQLHSAHEAGVTSHSGRRSWNFMNSFVYCFTIVTTIGYGHIVPTTFYGRIATIFYAIIGIPLFLIVLTDFGKLLTRIMKFFWAFIRRLYYTGSCRKVRKTVPMQEMMRGLNMVYDVVRRPSQMLFEDDVNAVRNPAGEQAAGVADKPEADTEAPPPLPPKPGQPTWVVGSDEHETTETPAPSNFEIDDEFNLPISVAIVVLILYILVGAVVYMSWEEWTFLESFYFVFVSMSTIGFGDLVPGHPMYMMCSIIYLVFGLALTSMCINVVQVKLSDTFKQASAKIGATIGLRVEEEEGGLVPITPTEVAPVHQPRQRHDTDVEPEIEKVMKSE